MTPSQLSDLLLHYKLKMSIKEMMPVTGQGESACKMSLHRARESLRSDDFKQDVTEYYDLRL